MSVGGTLLTLLLIVRFELVAYATFAATAFLGVIMVWNSRRSQQVRI